MGLGRFGGGVGVSRFLVEQGARVLVTDQADAAALADSLAALEGLPIEYRLGRHETPDFTHADLVVANPAVDPRRNVYLQAARRAGVPITSEIELLIERLPARRRTIGVTGTSGKSTVTAMIGHILRETLEPDETGWPPNVRVGGNIGGSLLGEVSRIEPHDWVVLELSSFMLEMIGDWSPHIAVVTNVSPNHLDRHGTLDAYVAAKQTILRHQSHDDRAILGPGVAEWRYHTPAVAIVEDEPWDEVELVLPGAFNRMNGTLAAAAAECAGVERTAALEALGGFEGLPHRLQLIAEAGGVRYINDSKCTTPVGAARAIEAFEPNCVRAILGGYDKQSDLLHLARLAAERCRGIYTIGQTGAVMADAAEAHAKQRGTRCGVYRCGDLANAVTAAAAHARAGQVVLLSPGCASWDQYANYEQRGAAFAAAVHRVLSREPKAASR